MESSTIRARKLRPAPKLKRSVLDKASSILDICLESSDTWPEHRILSHVTDMRRAIADGDAAEAANHAWEARCMYQELLDKRFPDCGF